MTSSRDTLLRTVSACAILLSVRRAVAFEEGAEFAAKLTLSVARTEYLEGKYDQASQRLRKAEAACDSDKCSPGSKAAILRELGATEFNRGNEAAVPDLFGQARTLAPNLPFLHDDEPQLLELWNRAGGAEEAQAPEDVSPSERESEKMVEHPRLEPWVRVWIGITGAMDLLFLPAGKDVCKLSNVGVPVNGSHTHCTNPDGSDFPSTRTQNDALVPGLSGSTDGGIAIGNVRVLFTADYAPSPSFLVGARIGYVLNAYPGQASFGGFPWPDRNLHAEIRGTYLFGSRPLARTGFAPAVFLAFGAAEFDGHARTFASVAGVAGQRPVNLWTLSGPWFVAMGGGPRYQFSPRAAFTAAVRMNATIGATPLLTVGPELSVAYGF